MIPVLKRNCLTTTVLNSVYWVRYQRDCSTTPSHSHLISSLPPLVPPGTHSHLIGSPKKPPFMRATHRVSEHWILQDPTLLRFSDQLFILNVCKPFMYKPPLYILCLSVKYTIWVALVFSMGTSQMAPYSLYNALILTTVQSVLVKSSALYRE